MKNQRKLQRLMYCGQEYEYELLDTTICSVMGTCGLILKSPRFSDYCEILYFGLKGRVFDSMSPSDFERAVRTGSISFSVRRRHLSWSGYEERVRRQIKRHNHGL